MPSLDDQPRVGNPRLTRPASPYLPTSANMPGDAAGWRGNPREATNLRQSGHGRRQPISANVIDVRHERLWLVPSTRCTPSHLRILRAFVGRLARRIEALPY